MAAEIESMSKSVQELVIDGKESLEKYIQKGNDSGKLNTSVSLIEVPIVDIGLLKSPLTRTEELHKLRSALSSWGCFQVINHGMTSSFLEEMRQVAKQFFSLPMEEKQKYSRKTGSIEGEMLDEFAKKSQQINEILLKEMAGSLGLDENCFLDQYGERPLVTARFNYYPPCPMPDKILGLKPHADGSALTILLQDKEVEGLQFLKDNQWFRVPIIPEALLVNVGDQAEGYALSQLPSGWLSKIFGGRVLKMLKLESTPINTKGYESLSDLVENTAGDSFDLYYGLFMYNKNALEMLERLDLAFESLRKQLFERLHEAVRKQLFGNGERGHIVQLNYVNGRGNGTH
ncbi:hypothetical protein JCGZ_00344 [Jatropha curcas]|uniref:Fe2OG dioxygenase domain-containing protein n=1 Tax=Jatropha curcas TaxID=180498 RepID=A0A067JGV4_JATCU|nr:hypothetical protein JCGZ_00344 [Jatropha curcas]